MAFKVGGMFISLAASPTQFKADMQSARSSARKSSRGISNSFKGAKKSSMGLTKSINSLKSSLFVVAGPLAMVIAIQKGINAYAEMEKGLREVGTLMGGLTDGQMKRMGMELQNISVRTGQAMDALTKAKYDIVSAGFTDAADSAKVLETAADLAVGSVIDVAIASDLLTTTLNAYNKSADSSVDISDKLFTIVRLGKTTMTELAGSMGRVLAIAGQADVSLDEVGAAMAALTAQGQSTEEATTAVRSSIVELLKPGAKLKKIIEEIGYESGTAIIKEKGFAESLKLIAAKAKETNTPMTDVFGNVRSLQAVLPLTGTAADLFSENLKQMGNSAGATQRAFTEMESSVSLQMDRLKAKAHNAAIRLGASLLPAVLSVTEAFSEFLKQPVSEKLRDEQTEFNALMEILKDTNYEQDTRNKAIKELMDNYSGYIGNLDLEKASYEDLAKAQKIANDEFERKIRLSVADDILKEKAREVVTALKRQFEMVNNLEIAQIKYNKAVAKGTGLWAKAASGYQKAKTNLEFYQKASESARGEVDLLEKEYQELYNTLIKQGFIITENKEVLDKTEVAYRKAAKAVAEYKNEVKGAGEETNEFKRLTDLQKSSLQGITRLSNNMATAFLNAENRGVSAADAIDQAWKAALRSLAAQIIGNAFVMLLMSMFAPAKGAALITKSGGFWGSLLSGFKFSQGGVIGRTGIQPFAKGDVVNRPTLFAHGGSGGLGLMGEAGSEAILPLARMSGGDLGVKASGGGSKIINLKQEFHFEGVTDEDYVRNVVGPLIEDQARKGLTKILTES